MKAKAIILTLLTFSLVAYSYDDYRKTEERMKPYGFSVQEYHDHIQRMIYSNRDDYYNCYESFELPFWYILARSERLKKDHYKRMARRR